MKQFSKETRKKNKNNTDWGKAKGLETLLLSVEKFAKLARNNQLYKKVNRENRNASTEQDCNPHIWIMLQNLSLHCF